MKLQESALGSQGYVRDINHGPSIVMNHEEYPDFNSRLDKPVYKPTFDTYGKAL